MSEETEFKLESEKTEFKVKREKFLILYKTASSITRVLVLVAILLTMVFSQAIPIFSIITGRALEAFEDHPTNDGAFANAILESITYAFIWAAICIVLQTAGTALFIIIGRRQL